MERQRHGGWRSPTFSGMFAQQNVYYNHLQSIFVTMMIAYDCKSGKVTYLRNIAGDLGVGAMRKGDAGITEAAWMQASGLCL